MLNERKKKKRKEMKSCDALDGFLKMSIISNKHLELEALYFHQYNRITIFSKGNGVVSIYISSSSSCILLPTFSSSGSDP